jgi:gliding motility-associated lipoprotein GldB
MIAISNKTPQIYLFFLTLLLIVSCGRHKKVDVSNIHLDVKIERFDKDFDSMQYKPMATQAAFLEKKYGYFYEDFIQQILQAGQVSDTAYFQVLRDMFKGQAYHDLKHDVDSVYPNLDEQNAELTDAFRRIKYYFPQQRIPKVYAYFSGFEVQRSIGNDYCAIGLDLFLGGNSRFYPALTKAYPHYLSRFFNPQNIAPRVVEGIIREDMFPEHDDDKPLLDRMIYNGKIMYLMDQILPDVPDSTKIGYTTKQYEWATQFEGSIWGYFMEQNLLYEADYNKIQAYVSVAPFTPGLGEHNESAPKLGIWTGWQIVKQYMSKHPDVTLAQLMAETDNQKILNGAKYHPADVKPGD